MLLRANVKCFHWPFTFCGKVFPSLVSFLLLSIVGPLLTPSFVFIVGQGCVGSRIEGIACSFDGHIFLPLFFQMIQ